MVGPPSTTDLLAATIAPLLTATVPVEWKTLTNDAAVTTTLASQSGPRIWIDGRSSGKVQIVAFRRDAVPRVRTVEAPELTPVVAETVAQITRETAVALLAEAAASAPPAGGERGSAAGPAPAPAPADSGPTITASAVPGNVPAAQPRNLLFAGSLIVRDEYGFGAEAAYGGQISAAYLFRRDADDAMVRPYLCLSLGLFGDAGFGLTALEAVETTGISWQASSRLDLAVGLGGGVVNAPNTRAFLIGRGTASLGLRLGWSASWRTCPWRRRRRRESGRCSAPPSEASTRR